MGMRLKAWSDQLCLLGTQDMSWCLRHDYFSLISPHSALQLLLRMTFFVLYLIALLPLEQAATSAVSLLWWICRACSECQVYSPSCTCLQTSHPSAVSSVFNYEEYSFKSKPKPGAVFVVASTCWCVLCAIYKTFRNKNTETQTSSSQSLLCIWLTSGSC